MTRVVHLEFGPLPPLVRARLTALLSGEAGVALEAAAPQSTRSRATRVRIAEWPHAEDQDDGRTATVMLLAAGVQPTETHSARRATAWIPMDAADQVVVAAVHAVAAGLTVTAPVAIAPERHAATDGNGAWAGSGARDAHAERTLTDRELDVLRALADGLVNKEIATRLGISASTVKFHLQAIFTKLGVRTRAEAVSQGLRRGVVPL